MSKTTETHTKKPDAEIIGTLADVMKRGGCTQKRSLFQFLYFQDIGNPPELFVEAKTELQAREAMHAKLGVMKKMTKAELAERTRKECLKLMEERNAEPDPEAETKGDEN